MANAKMSTDIRTCYIFSEDKTLPALYLPDNQEIFVGRNVDTQIKDPQCSRKQVRLLADYQNDKVYVQQLGAKPSGLNGFQTEKGEKYVAEHGGRLEVLYGKYPYKIEFNPPPTLKKQCEKVAKRIFSQDSQDSPEEDSTRDSKRAKMSIDSLDVPVPQSSKTEDKMSVDDVCPTNNKMFDNVQSGAWETFDNKTLYVYTSSGCKGRSKIAAYDMDKTLIKTISGLEFPKDCNDWQLLYPEVPGKIKKFYQDGYKIVILSNQASLGTGRISLKDFKLKIERLVKKIGVPMQVYLAVGQSIYRKPRTGMWDFLVNKKNDGVLVEKEISFYVGDAAGRPANPPRRKKDHSLADRLLALNLGLTFYTPEEHFLGHKKATYNGPTFDPKEASKNTILCEPTDAVLTKNKQELVLMVGCPGSGKSHFAKTHLKNYCYVNRDVLGNWQKCVAKTDEALAQGKSVVVDNTNPDKATRQRYIDVARKHKVPVRCFVMTLEKEHIKHNNMFRTLTDPTHQAISDMIINTYIDTNSKLVRRCVRFLRLFLLLCLRFYITFSIRFSKTVPTSYRKNFTPPSEDEGYSEIVRIKFVPCFKSEEERRLYEMYLLG